MEISLDIGNLVVGVAGVVAVVLVGWRIRYQQTREAAAREDISIDVDVRPTLIASRIMDGIPHAYVLETRIEVHNNCRRQICIPAAYVTARALVVSDQPRQHHGNYDYESLPKSGVLTEVVNVTRLPNSVIQLAPDETEQFVRWDTLDDNFIKDFPVIVVNVEVFATSAHDIGISGGRVPSLRLEWLRFMNEEDYVRHKYIIFARLPIDHLLPSPPCQPGERYFCRRDGSADTENTKLFREVLKPMAQWSRQTTVNLRQDRQQLEAAIPNGCKEA